MPADVRHVLTILAVEDLAASRSFYRAAFGWTPAVETPVYVELVIAGGQRIGLYQREAFGRNTGQAPVRIPSGAIGPAEIYLQADDLGAAIDRLKAAGARELSTLARRAWGDDAAYFADPSGHVIVLARPARDDELSAPAGAQPRAPAAPGPPPAPRPPSEAAG